MMRFLRTLFLLMILGLPCLAQTNALDNLQEELNKKPLYDKQKEASINEIKQTLGHTLKTNLQLRYMLYCKLFDEYKSYQYDSAYVYAGKLQELSHSLKSPSKEYYSQIKIGFILISSGMFKETFDNLKGIKARMLDDSIRFEYYSLLTRACYDLAAFDNDQHYTPYYNALANKYIDSAIVLTSDNSYDRIYLTGYKKLKNGQPQAAEADFNELLNHHKLTQHQMAIVGSTLGSIYSDIPAKHDRAVELMARASICDIQTSTKETVALFWLAQLLYKTGDIKNVYVYLEQALADAEFYGARQRKIQIGTLLPIVAAEKLNYSEREKTRFLIYLASITALALLVIWFSVMLSRQLKVLKIKEKIIDDKNIQLEKINERLVEGTKIKEEYIGYFFNVISGYILQLEKLKRSIDTKLTIKKYDDIQIIIDKINIKKDRDTLFYTFDHVFIKIFPNFVDEFNALFKPEDQIWPKDHEVLTTDLRIFALMRMGINDTETIAKILEYSEKTIYVYKMRIKAKAIIPGDQFDHHIMEIKAVDLKQE